MTTPLMTNCIVIATLTGTGKCRASLPYWYYISYGWNGANVPASLISNVEVRIGLSYRSRRKAVEMILACVP